MGFELESETQHGIYRKYHIKVLFAGLRMTPLLTALGPINIVIGAALSLVVHLGIIRLQRLATRTTWRYSRA